MALDITVLQSPRSRDLPLEIVERKGSGHPDTICDALTETFSCGLSSFYVERFGTVLHHNVDKALLCGGAAQPAFAGGKLLAPIEIHLAGRATSELDGVEVPVDAIAIEGSREWIRENLRHLNPERDVRIITHVRSTSPELASLFRRGQSSGALLANDTSVGVGFAPLDELERIVLAVERRLNAPETKRIHPCLGEDVKVMGVRRGSGIELTIGCAIVGRYIPDLEAYRQSKQVAHGLAIEAARSVCAAPVQVEVNVSDIDSSEGIYLTVTGLSAESGDDGQAGRGNRVNGLITPYRPMSLEGACGKNPITHVGKLYSVMAQRIAQAVVTEVAGIEEAYCYLLGRIGRRVDEPEVFEVKVRPVEATLDPALMRTVSDVARTALSGISSLWEEAVTGALRLW